MPWYAWAAIGFLAGVWTLLLAIFLVFATTVYFADDEYHYPDEP